VIAEPLAITRLLNQAFAVPVYALLHVVGVTPRHPAAPINNAFALGLLIAALMLAFFVVVRATLSVEKPAPVQQFAEMIHEFVGGQAEQIIGHGYEKFQSFATVVFLFILSCNLIGLIPGINSPTELETVTLALATATFIFYNYHGFRANGVVGYLKQFAGPVWWLSWLLLPIELVSHFARIMSLSVRLYANMFAGGLVTLVFFSLVPVGVPVIFLGLHLLVSVIQAFVFMLLVMIYLSVAVSHDH
jgi:F-type H+-transporting ATPase subunit a